MMEGTQSRDHNARLFGTHSEIGVSWIQLESNNNVGPLISQIQ